MMKKSVAFFFFSLPDFVCFSLLFFSLSLFHNQMRLLLTFALFCVLSEAQITWVATGGGTTNSLAYSFDGSNWTGVGKSMFSIYGSGVACNYSPVRTFVAVGNGANNSIATSSDGISWTGLGKSIFSSRGNGVAYSAEKGIWVAVGIGSNSAATSTNGSTWTGLGSFFGSANAVAYGAGRWIIVGQGVSGCPFACSTATSTDAAVWSGVADTSLQIGYGVAYGQRKWVAVGTTSSGSSPIVYSSDGLSWRDATTASGIFASGSGIAFSSKQQRWIATGTGTTLAYSQDGIIWNAVTNNANIFTGFGTGVAFSSTQNKWVATGNGGNSLAISADGTTWTGLSSSAFSGGATGVAVNEPTTTVTTVTALTTSSPQGTTVPGEATNTIRVSIFAVLLTVAFVF